MEAGNKNKLTLAILLLVLLALPVISLFYSYEGVKFRKTALNELSPKGNLPTSLSSQLPSEARYRLIISNCDDHVSVDAVINQFMDEKVEFVFLNDSISYKQLKSIDINKWSKKNILIQVNDPNYTIRPSEFVLTDEKYQILNTYSLSNEMDKTKLIEHIAFLITKK